MNIPPEYEKLRRALQRIAGAQLRPSARGQGLIQTYQAEDLVRVARMALEDFDRSTLRQQASRHLPDPEA